MRKAFAIIAVIAATVVGITLMPSTAAVAAPAIGELRNGTGQPTIRGWSICLDVPGGDSDAGTSVRLYPLCNGTPAQRITMDVSTVGEVRILGKCLDVQGGGIGSGTRVQIWNCNGSAAQRWETFRAAGVFPVTLSSFFLRNPNSGRCLIANGDGAVIENCPTTFDPVLSRQMTWDFAASSD